MDEKDEEKKQHKILKIKGELEKLEKKQDK